MSEANKKKHNELTLAALTWLRNKVTGKGIRGTTEVSLDSGYVADAVVLCSLQYRFFTKYTGKGFPEALTHRENYFACIFEAKASRSDFLSTFNNSPKHQNRRQPIGSLHWCVTPKGLITPSELPDFWGLLEERGSGLSEIKQPILQTVTDQQFDKIAHSLLWTIQSRRNYMICKKCGRWVLEGYCGRCYEGINQE